MLDLTLWETKLQDASTDLKKIGRASGLAQAQQELKQDPAAFFIPGTEKAGENRFGNAVDQTVTVAVGVVIGIKNAGAKTGAKNIDELKTIRAQIDNALLGWQPADANDQIEYVSGRLLGFNDQVLWWMDFYQTTYTKRAIS